MLPVAVEIAPPDAPRDAVTALLAACTRAVAEAECVPAAEAPEGGTQAVAIVTWQGDEQAFVEVGMRKNGQPEWRSRAVRFAPEDELLERWRTVGFVVGTLARGDAPEPEEKPAPAPKVTPPVAPVVVRAKEPPRALPATAPRRTAARAAIDLGGEVGPALGGKMRYGGLLRTRWPLQDPLRAVVSLKYLEQNNITPDARWFTVGVGLAGVVGNEHADLSFQLDARAEYFQPHLDTSTVSDTAVLPNPTSHSRLLSGIGAGIAGAWMPMPMLGLYIGGDIAQMFGTTHLTGTVTHQSIITDNGLRIGVDAGVRLRLW